MSEPWKRRVDIGPHVMFQGDCLEILPTLGPVDAVVTSPPYDDLRTYGEGFGGVDCEAVISLLAEKIVRGGVIVWNVADQTIDGSESGTSFRQALHAKSCGLRLHDTMIYCKESVTFPDKNRYHPAFEYMFVFSNGAPAVFNGKRDWPNKWAGSKIHGTARNRDGSVSGKSRDGKDIPPFGLRRNWWVVANPGKQETCGHPAPMPYSIAADHIQTWTNFGAAVLDPFAGSGTTGVACVREGRRFIGIELDPGYFEIAVERIRKEMAQPRLDLPTPEQPKQETFL